MPGKTHHYPVTVTWTGNTGDGTAKPNGYSKDHEVSGEGKPVIPVSSDPAFNGDPARWNPEELLVASLSQCHMLWFLSRCAKAGVVVTAYVDRAEGVMIEDRDGGGRFDSVVLRPEITLANGADQKRADAQHHEAHRLCFIANSVNFPVTVEPVYRAG
ncbi:MAG TPA: OsmC family protein [Thermomicrobiales bacterium]|nr:OsmC family protein [Thermomicrobiales bacterium]